MSDIEFIKMVQYKKDKLEMNAWNSSYDLTEFMMKLGVLSWDQADKGQDILHDFFMKKLKDMRLD